VNLVRIELLETRTPYRASLRVTTVLPGGGTYKRG